MRFKKFLPPLAALAAVAFAAVTHAQTVEITPLNRNLFLRIQGTLRLACHLPSPTSQRSYGFVSTTTGPNGTPQEIFNTKTLSWAVAQKKKYDKNIVALLKQIAQSRRAGLAAKVAAYKNTLRLRKKARQEVAALLVGCPKFLPELTDFNYPVPTPTPGVAEDECIEPSDNPFHFPYTNFGLVSISPGQHGMRFYVDPELGDDNAISKGLSEDDPLRTIAKAKQLVSLASEANYSPHQILLRRGRTFTEPFGTWSFKGLSQDEPFVLADYGDKELPRPILTNPLVINGAFSNIVISGLEFFAPTRYPYSPNFNPTASDATAITITGAVDRVLIQDSLFSYWTNGVKVVGASSARPGQAKELTLHRNGFRDLYSNTGAARGVSFERTNGVVLTENVFARIGNPQYLSESYVNAGQGVGPGLVPSVDSVGAKVGPLNECYAVVRGNQFLKSPRGLDIRGFVLDQYNQLQPFTQEVEVYSNLFYGVTKGMFIDANAVLLRQNAVMNGRQWGGIVGVEGIDVKNSSALKMFFNVIANSESGVDSDYEYDFAIRVHGHADMGYHDVHHNTIRHWPGGLHVGPLTWYDYLVLPNLGGGTRNVPVNYAPKELLYHDNIIQNADSDTPLITMARTDRGTNYIQFLRNTLFNPARAQQRLWAYQEIGQITNIEVVYQPDPPNCTPYVPADWAPGGVCTIFGGLFWAHCNDQCPPPVCQSVIISVNPHNRKQVANWYNGASFVQTNPANGQIVASNLVDQYLTPNKHKFGCDVLGQYSEGAPYYLYKEIGWARWLEYAVAGGNNDPDGDRVLEVVFNQPNRTLPMFIDVTHLRLLGANGLRLADTEDDYIEYVTRKDKHLPPQDMSLDFRVDGKNVSQYFIVGFNTPPPAP